MKRVAIIAPEFPPCTTPTALRSRFLVPYLREFGWEPTIITTAPEYYDQPIDWEMMALMPDHVEIIRTGALDIALTRHIGLTNIGVRAIAHHWNALRKSHKQRPFDAVFISVPPYHTMLLGRLSHQLLGLPYVIDYQDPWSSSYYRSVPLEERPGGRKWRIANMLAGVLEPLAVRRAAQITAVSRATTDGVAGKYTWMHEISMTEIPLGGEPTDLEYVKAHPRPNAIFDPSDGLFHMSYVGRVIGGMHPALRALFRAVELGIETSPTIFQRIRLHFVGTSYTPGGTRDFQVLSLASGSKVAELVDEHPERVSYLDALQIQLDSQGLLAIGSDQPHYTASKIFPLILVEHPLLAIFHESSSVVGVLDAAGSAPAITFSKVRPPSERVEEISRVLETILLGQSAGVTLVDPTKFSQFTARSMSERLASVLHAAAP